MPNIAEYNATGEITPSDKGIQAAEVAGRRVGQFYHQIQGDVQGVTSAFENHMAVMESSELYKTGTELRVNLQKRYTEESALPENRNNPHFGDQFMAEVGPQLDAWGNGAGTDHGKMLAAEMKGQIRSEIFHHVVGGQAEMDTAHVDDNLTQLVNGISAGLMFDPSEANLNRSIGTIKDATQGITMQIPDVAMRERVASEISAVRIPQVVLSRYHAVGESIKSQIAQTGGETSPALEQLNKDIANQVGFQYLSPDMQARIPAIRDEAVRQGQEQFRAKDATNRKAESDQFDAALLPIETSLFRPNGAGGVTMVTSPDALAAVQRAAAMPGAKQHPEKIEALLSAMHTATQDALTGKETTTDHGAYVNLSSRIGSTTDPLTKAEVDTLRAQNKLSDTDYHFLREAASDSKSANPKINHALEELHRWQTEIKPMIDKSDPLAGSVDQQGTEKFSYFTWDTETALRKAIQSGEDPDKAVQRLTDPRNARGYYRFIPQYQTTNKQGLAGVMKMITPDGVQQQAPLPGGRMPGTGTGGPPPPMKGESPAAYLKRTGQ